MKGIVEALLDRLHIAGRVTSSPAWITPASRRAAPLQLLLAARRLGFLGEVARDRLDEFDLRSRRAAVAELDFDVLVARADLVPQHRPLPAFPVGRRATCRWSSRWPCPGPSSPPAVRECRRIDAGRPEFLDTFQGGDIPADRHSLHFGLTFRHPERTLTGDEVDSLGPARFSTPARPGSGRPAGLILAMRRSSWGSSGTVE